MSLCVARGSRRACAENPWRDERRRELRWWWWWYYAHGTRAPSGNRPCPTQLPPPPPLSLAFLLAHPPTTRHQHTRRREASRQQKKPTDSNDLSLVVPGLNRRPVPLFLTQPLLLYSTLLKYLFFLILSPPAAAIVAALFIYANFYAPLKFVVFFLSFLYCASHQPQ